MYFFVNVTKSEHFSDYILIKPAQKSTRNEVSLSSFRYQKTVSSLSRIGFHSRLLFSSNTSTDRSEVHAIPVLKLTLLFAEKVPDVLYCDYQCSLDNNQ